MNKTFSPKTWAAIVLLFFSMYLQKANATAISAAASGNWNSTSTWSGGAVPTSGDAVTIAGGYTVTVDVSGAACSSLQLGSTSSGTLTFNSSADLTVGGTTTVGGSSAAGTLTMVSGATFTTNTLASGTTSPTYNLNAGTIVFKSSFTLPTAATSFNNVTINSGATVSLSATISMAGTLTVNGRLFCGASASNFKVTGGTVTGTGILDVTSTNHSPDDLANQFTGTRNLTNMTLYFDGCCGTPYLGAVTCAAINSSNGFGLQITGNVTCSGTIHTDYDFVPSNGSVVITGTMDGNSSNGAIYVKATGNTNDLATQYPGTINSNVKIGFNGSAAQTLSSSISPYGFTISNSSGVTFSANETPGSAGTVINSGGVLAVSSGHTLSGAVSGASAYGTIKVLASGNSNDLTAQYTGTLTLTNLKIDMAGSGAQTLNSAISPYGFIISNTSSTVTFSANMSPGSGGTSVSSGATLALGSSNTLSGSLSGSGTIKVTASGNSNDLTTQYTGTLTLTNLTVQYAGSGAQNLPSGTYSTFNVSNSSGTSLQGAVVISSGLTLGTGNLALGSNNLTINSGATITGASSSSYIMINGSGKVIAKAVTSKTIPIGDEYAPVQISNGGGADYTIGLTNSVTDNGGSPTLTAHAVGITWSISPSSTVSNVSITLQWPGANELTSFDRTTSYLAYRTSTSGTWVPLSGGTAASGSDPYTQTGTISSMTSGTTYYFGVGDATGASALPVTLTRFDAIAQGHTVALAWYTASEINNSYFEIQRSANGLNWETAGRVQGHGSTTAASHYETMDDLQGMLIPNTLYYRLKQVDYNGSSSYSAIKAVHFITAPSAALSVYPNPSKGSINILWNNQSAAPATLKLMNMSGQIICTQSITGSGNMQQNISLAPYPAGVYEVQVVTDGKVMTERVMKY